MVMNNQVREKKILLMAMIILLLAIVGCNNDNISDPEIDISRNDFEQKTEIEYSEFEEVIAESHEILNEAVGFGQTPSVEDRRKMSRMGIKLENLMQETKCGGLQRDLEKIIECTSKVRNRDKWVTAHRIAHDLDKVVLGNPTECGMYWDASHFIQKTQKEKFQNNNISGDLKG